MTPLRELSEAERAKRIGNLESESRSGQWRFKVGGKPVLYSTDKAKAFAAWEAKMIELGHGLAPGPNFFWNAIEQRWDKGESAKTSLKYATLKTRAKVRSKLIAEKKRLLAEKAALIRQIDAECIARRAACDKLISEQRVQFAAQLVKMRVEYRASLTVKERERFDANRQRIRTRVNQKLLLRVEKLQRISRPWKDKESGLWFSWVGCEHRKLVRLGDEEEKARVVWWVLRNALNEGARMLRKPEGTQKTLDELLDIAPDRVRARLRELGWIVEPPGKPQ